MFRKTLLVALVSGAMVSGVQAAGVQANGYLFGSVGQSDAEKPGLVKDLDAGLQVDIANGWQGSSSFDDTDTAFKVGAGVQLNSYVGVELQYIDLGEIAYKLSETNGANALDYKMSAGTKGYGGNVVGTLPLDQFKLFGKVGYHKLKTKVKQDISVTGVGQVKGSDSANEWVTSYGIGASFAFTPQVELVAEYERYRDVADEYDVDFASIGLRYNF